jgi:lysine 2,3-aminomutase
MRNKRRLRKKRQLEKWQVDLRNCVRALGDLEKYVHLKDKELLQKVVKNMRLAITPHTLSLIDFGNLKDPILLMCVPQAAELDVKSGESDDPTGDEVNSPIPFLVRKYQDRVLVCVNYSCAQYCRFCFRRRKTGCARVGATSEDRRRIIGYISTHPEIEEVILTGGDPLILPDNQIENWLKAIRGVPNIKRVRIHTRVLVTLPSRITNNLVAVLKRNMDATRPIYVVTHFNHPREIVEANIRAIAKLADAGIVLRNQNPLLAGINDDAKTLEELYRRLFEIRVAPYYLHHLDRAKGIGHFRVPIKRGRKIMNKLRAKLSNSMLPRYVIDSPEGKSEL